MVQDVGSWHHEGLYMGMHWIWWFLWIGTLLVLGWAFWRLYADRAGVRRDEVRMMQAEELLRQRFARGEIDEEELSKKIAALKMSRRELRQAEPQGHDPIKQ